MRTLVVCGLVLLAACNKPESTPPSTTPEPTGGDVPPADADGRPQLTAAACEAQGGKVIGDIGDGAIHKPDYVCPDTAEKPIGSIVAEPGGPVAIEGSVCCK